MSGFRFRRIHVQRMPGVASGFELRDLASGVNVVYGPNASGKTTTARALEALLWPRSADRESTSVEAVAELGEDRWSVRVDTGLVQYQQNGLPASPPPTAPAENRDRYRLWLPDLLRADDVDFARRILIESSGGFDLQEAASSLDRKHPTHRQRQQQQELRKARERVREARAAQALLANERSALVEKAARLEIAPVLERELQTCRLAVEHARRREEATFAREKVDAFPTNLARIRGDEADQVRTLRERLEKATTRFAAAEVSLSRAERELNRLALPAAIFEGDLLFRLQADLDRLGELDREILEQEKTLAAATVRLGEEAAGLGDVAEPGRLAALDLSGLGRLRDVVEQAEAVRETRRAIAAEMAALPEAVEPSGDLDRLRHGAFLLDQWLAAGRDETGEGRYVRALVICALGVVGFACFLLLLSGAYFSAFAILACGGLLLFGYRRAPRREDAQPDREREYLRLGLMEAPDLWDAPSVIRCLATLQERVDGEGRAERTRQRKQELVGRSREAATRDQSASERLREVAAEFGLDVAAEGPRLLWLVERVNRWQRARVDRLAAERALVTVCAEQRAILEAANQRLEPLDIDPMTETRSLKGTVDRLRADLSAHENAARSCREAQEQAANAREDIDRLNSEIKKILDKVGLDSSTEDTLPELCRQAETYRQQVRSLEVADSQRAHLERSLRELPGFDESLLEAPSATLAIRATEVEREVGELRTLGEEVGSLRAKIGAAIAGHTLEDALAEESRRSQALLDVRARELRAAVGALLVDHVEKETRSEHLPEVFHRANELFNRITRGAYELRVEMSDAPAFRAYDTRLDRGFALDELSSGTRVQLLFAVRIAFVECLESGVALPLLMDETLANSDDERAAAIMDAVIQLASDGRQVFYFTAQPDEVAKWTRALKATPEVEFARFDLGEVRKLGSRLDFDLLEVAEVGPTVPEPAAGMDHREYGRRLRVPRVDIHGSTAALHLWYLVEEPTLLHHLLANLNVATWGELRSIMSTGGPLLLEPLVYTRVEAAAGIAETAIDRIRVGRGRPVDRRALVASGAVSDRFIDEVDALAQSHRGDARQLLLMLESRSVPKFQSRNVEALREHLEREGYLDTRDPVNVEIIRRQIVAEQSVRSTTGGLTLAEIDRLLARVAMGAGFPLQPRKQVSTHQSQLFPEAPV